VQSELFFFLDAFFLLYDRPKKLNTPLRSNRFLSRENMEQEFVQLLNTAIIKSKEKRIDSSFEERLSQVCNKPAIKALSYAIEFLADSQKISRDQAAVELVESVRELDLVWNDYVMLEGLGKLKAFLKDSIKH